jgi:hypothetical protein
MKRISSATVITFLFVICFNQSIFANTQIMNTKRNGRLVHDVIKNDERVGTCLFCHQKSGIKKIKVGYRISQDKYKELGRNANCSGSDCHN